MDKYIEKYTTVNRMERIRKMISNLTINGFATVHNNQIIKQNTNIGCVLKELGGETLEFKTAGATGLTFKSYSLDKSIQFAIKIVAYSKHSNYGDIYNEARPENAELKTIYLLSKLVLNHKTPHIVLPITCFNTDISYFVDENNISALQENNKYKKFLTSYKEDRFDKEVSVLISEWVNYGDLLSYLRKKIDKLSDSQWRVLLFQIISTLAVIHQKYPSFRHNDLKANNILIQGLTDVSSDNDQYFEYNINSKKYSVPVIGALLKIWDFDFACIPGVVDNNKVSSTWAGGHHIFPNQNRYYDLHFLLNSLSRPAFIPDFWTKLPPETKKFIERVIPPEYRYTDVKDSKGRLMDDIEYVLPIFLIEKDPYFEEFRVKEESKKKDEPIPIKVPEKKVKEVKSKEQSISKKTKEEVPKKKSSDKSKNKIKVDHLKLSSTGSSLYKKESESDNEIDHMINTINFNDPVLQQILSNNSLSESI